jgi:hypothetical protein
LIITQVAIKHLRYFFNSSQVYWILCAMIPPVFKISFTFPSLLRNVTMVSSYHMFPALERLLSCPSPIYRCAIRKVGRSSTVDVRLFIHKPTLAWMEGKLTHKCTMISTLLRCCLHKKKSCKRSADTCLICELVAEKPLDSAKWYAVHYHTDRNDHKIKKICYMIP